MIYSVMSDVKTVTVKNVVATNNLLQGKTKNLLEKTTLVNVSFMKVFYKTAICRKQPLLSGS